MESSSAYEQSQRFLRQRNLMVIVTLALAIVSVILLVVAFNRDREVILQPIAPREMSLSSKGVSRDYLEAVTRDTAQLALNRSPETLKYWMESLLAITAPSARGDLQTKLLKIFEEQNGSQITQFLTIDWIDVDPETLTSQVGGVLHTVVADKEVSRDHRVFEFSWKYSGMTLKLTSFGVLVDDEGDKS
ncbi:conjugal transfer protein TraE [Altericroceibacterium spongiae]|uniref:Conjugal transfer protein TraE n=1 Tax=Altericroceibacterium spongiae TaxID=2320269 RepID=A0A420EAI6_9SPHN|nr:type IV conjugative transfer system protein TraE [Altericroceibacterium spongiae]RKF17699.1 conjugal transfer protein TraE [Altericroceibacterium spongiae]